VFAPLEPTEMSVSSQTGRCVSSRLATDNCTNSIFASVYAAICITAGVLSRACRVYLADTEVSDHLDGTT
jgi:hypothetical protein